MNTNHFQQHSLLAVVTGAAILCLMVVLLESSRLWYVARYSGPLLIGLTLMGVGTLFKIEHWPFADALLLTGAAFVVGTYALWFKGKSGVGPLDYLKLAWVLGVGLTVLALVLYRPLLKPATRLTNVVFWMMALLFIYQRWFRRAPQAPE